MPQDLFHYDKMVENALRGVVRTALERVAREGPRGAHHFYITFLTAAPGVTTKTLRVRVETRGQQGPSFAWSVVSVDDIAATARSAQLAVSDVWEGGGRWFSELVPG